MENNTDSFGNAVGGAGLLASIGNFLGQLFFREDNKNFAREQATTAFERQRQLFAEQNAFNSPKAQMQRFVEAGLNPFLAQGGISNGLPAPQVAQGNNAFLGTPQVDLATPLAMRNASVQTTLNTKKLDSEIAKNFAQAGMDEAQAGYVSQLCTLIPDQLEGIQLENMHKSYDVRKNQLDYFKTKDTYKSAVSIFESEAKLKDVAADHAAEYTAATILNLKGQAKEAFSAAVRNGADARMLEALGRLYNADSYRLEQTNKISFSRGKNKFGFPVYPSLAEKSANLEFNIRTSESTIIGVEADWKDKKERMNVWTGYINAGANVLQGVGSFMGGSGVLLRGASPLLTPSRNPIGYR